MNKFYKIVRPYNDRLFSLCGFSSECQHIINKEKRGDHFTTVEYRVNRWTYKPKIGNNYFHYKLFVYNGNEKLTKVLLDNYRESHLWLYECEVKNPEKYTEECVSTFAKWSNCVYLVDGVKLVKRIL